MHRPRLAAAALLALVSTASAQQTRVWLGGSPNLDWFDVPDNWSPVGVPGPLDTARFNRLNAYGVRWDDFTGDVTNAAIEVLAGDVSFDRISGDNRIYTVTDALFNTGRLNLSAGMTLRATTNGFVDLMNGGRLNVNAGAVFEAPDARIDFGFYGDGTENHLNVAGVVNSRAGSIAESAGRSGRATVSGASARWNMTDELYVGANGQGTLEVLSNAVVTNREGFLGLNPGSVGSATLNSETSGSTWTNTGNLSLGVNGGVGHLTIFPGSRLNVGDTTGSLQGYSIVVDDSSPNATDGGTLRVSSGSTIGIVPTPFIVFTGLYAGRNAGSSGRVVVTGAGSSVSGGYSASFGELGTGILDISAGGQFKAESHITFGSGSAASSGTATIDGAGSQMSSNRFLNINRGSVAATNGGMIRVGNLPNPIAGLDGAMVVSHAILPPSTNTQPGLVTISSGGTLTHNGRAVIGLAAGQIGKVVVNGAGSQWINNGKVELGYSAELLPRGELEVVNGGVLQATELEVNGDNSTIVVNSGGRITTTNRTTLGRHEGQATATVHGTNSRLQASTLNLGVLGVSTLNIQSGGSVSAGRTDVGIGVPSTINVTGPNASLAAGALSVGILSTGTLNIGNGGMVSASDLTINAISRINLSPGGTLVVDYPGGSPINTIRGYILTGYAGGAWTGNGITSPAAQTDSRLGVGYVDDGNLITVKLTLKGDTDLNGAVAFPDLLSLAQNYNQSSRYWQHGDFDYNGIVEFPDLLALAQNYNGAMLGSSTDLVDPGAGFQADWALARSLVPEPATMLMGLGLATVLLRRVRGCHGHHDPVG